MSVTYDKPRIASTIIIGIILTISLIITISLLPITWGQISEAIKQNSQSQESAAGQVTSAFALSLVAAMGLAVLIIVNFSLAISNGICLLFSIKNRKSIFLPVRIISYVYDVALAFVIVTSLVKAIMFIMGV